MVVPSYVAENSAQVSAEHVSNSGAPATSIDEKL